MDQMDYEVDLLDCLRVLGRRKWLILAIIMVSVLSAYIVSSKMTKIYDSSCVIMIRPNPLVGSIPGLTSSNIKDYVELFKSRTQVAATLATLGWPDAESQEVVDSWHKRLSVSQVQGTNMVKLSVEHDDPEKVVEFVNALVEMCEERSRLINRKSIKAAKAYVGEQLPMAEQRLREDEDALIEYKQNNDVTDLRIETIAGSARIVILEKLLSEASAKLQSANAKGSGETAGLKAEHAALDAALRKAKADLAAIPKKEIDIARLTRDFETSEETYTMLRSRYEEMELAEAIQDSEIYVIDKAIVPNKPIKPRKLLNTAIAGILGLFVAVGLAFVLEYTDKL